MLYAGLRPKGFRLKNEVSWLENENGVRFGKFGIIFSTKPKASASISLREFTIETGIKILKNHPNSSPTILALWNDKSPDWFQLLQWKKHVIAQKITGYFFKDKIEDIGAALELNKPHLITITSNNVEGTTLYIDGEKKSNSSTLLLCSENILFNRIVLGNSPSAQDPWSGEVYSFSLANCFYNENDVRERYFQWAKTKTPPVSNNLLAFYPFDEHNGEIIHDGSGKMGDLILPHIVQIPQKKILSMPWRDFRIDRSNVLDIIINFFGFMPFGSILYAFLFALNGFAGRHGILLIVIISGALMSLTIELAQVFIPTRDSQLTDLFFNILGTLVGAIAMKYYYNRSKTKE
jgi:hypothetical protein